ncbi:MAG: hypothetical protein NUV91_00240 [Candidatus Omnitrophica bacterium]|nr:hypothetical protein [Candidatus Omnitrophota bacterium]
MDIQKAWERALKQTEIVRSRVQLLKTFQETPVPYILLAESSINHGDTVVRKGEVILERPSLILPPNLPQFQGFEFDEQNKTDQDAFINFLLVRGVHFPSLRYNNQTYALDVFEGGLDKAIRYYSEQQQQSEDVLTGLIAGPEDCWQFSLLIYICSQIVKNANHDIRRLLDEYRRKHEQ